MLVFTLFNSKFTKKKNPDVSAPGFINFNKVLTDL